MIVKQQAIFALAPGSFDLQPTDPMYYTERLSYIITSNFYNLASAGFTFRQAEKMIADVNQTGLAKIDDATQSIDTNTTAIQDGLIIPESDPEHGDLAGQSWLSLADDGMSIDEDEIAETIWNAQTAALTGEIAYLKQIQTQFKDKETLLGDGKLADGLGYIKELAEEAIVLKITTYLATTLAAAGVAAGPIAFIGLAVGALVDFSLGKIFDKIIDMIKGGNLLLDAMIDEDTELIEAERSVTAYDARNAVMERHMKQIDMLLAQVAAAEKNAQEQITTGNISLDTTNLEAILKDALMRPQLDDNGSPVTDDDDNVLYEHVFDGRLEDLAYNDESFRVGDVEISTRGRYVKH